MNTIALCTSYSRAKNISLQSLISDCNVPVSQGYTFTYTDTTYEATASVVCATGYDGTPNPDNVACLDTGHWITVIGCNKKGTILSTVYNLRVT